MFLVFIEVFFPLIFFFCWKIGGVEKVEWRMDSSLVFFSSFLQLAHQCFLHHDKEACAVLFRLAAELTTFSVLLKMLKKICNNLVFICKSIKLASPSKKLNLRAVKCQSRPLGGLRWDDVVKGRLQVMFYTRSLIVLAGK